MEPDGGEWRFRVRITFIKVDTNAGKCGVFISKIDSIKQTVATSQSCICQAQTRSVTLEDPKRPKYFHVEGCEIEFYNFKPATRSSQSRWVGRITSTPNRPTSSYLPIKGGELTGNLQFLVARGLTQATYGSDCCFEFCYFRHPPIFSSGSGANDFSFYGFDSDNGNTSLEKAYITAGGEARNGVYSKGKELANKEYVDANAGGSSEGAIAKSPTPTRRWPKVSCLHRLTTHCERASKNTIPSAQMSREALYSIQRCRLLSGRRLEAAGADESISASGIDTRCGKSKWTQDEWE